MPEASRTLACGHRTLASICHVSRCPERHTAESDAAAPPTPPALPVAHAGVAPPQAVPSGAGQHHAQLRRDLADRERQPATDADAQLAAARAPGVSALVNVESAANQTCAARRSAHQRISGSGKLAMLACPVRSTAWTPKTTLSFDRPRSTASVTLPTSRRCCHTGEPVSRHTTR